jgi:triacylglycerol lipase
MSATDADLIDLVWWAEDAYSGALEVPGADLCEVAPDARLTAAWNVRGTLTGQDAILRAGPLTLGARRVFYGWLLESVATPGAFVLAIRGTDGILEWLEDAEFAPMEAHPVRGRVESGFWGIYQSMTLRRGAADEPLIETVAAIVGTGKLQVTGHSLGAPLATYAAFELAGRLSHVGWSVSARLFASPRPGDLSFATAFDWRVKNHVMYANKADLVPRVPFGFGYAHVPNVTELTPDGLVRPSIACQHHSLVYRYLIEPETFDPKWVTPRDADEAACLMPQSVS